MWASFRLSLFIFLLTGKCHAPSRIIQQLSQINSLGNGLVVLKTTLSWQYDVGSGGEFLINMKSSWHNYVLVFFVAVGRWLLFGAVILDLVP